MQSSRHAITFQQLRHVAVRLVIVSAIAAAFFLCGCASGRSVDGKTVVGFQVGAQLPDGAAEAATTAGGIVGGLFGGPAGATVGGSIAALIVGLIGAKKVGDATTRAVRAEAANTGYDEGHRDRANQQAYIDAAYEEGAARAAPVIIAERTAKPNPYATGFRDDRAYGVGSDTGRAGSDGIAPARVDSGAAVSQGDTRGNA